MKVVVVWFLAAVFSSVAALGQGQFVFNNRVPPDINARFITNLNPVDASSSSIGTEYTVQFFNVANGIQNLSLDPASTTFRRPAGNAWAGYVAPTTETPPGVPPGASATIMLRVVGPSPCGFDSQMFGLFTVTLGGGRITPPNLPMGTVPLTLVCVPETSTTPLVLLGLGALACCFRRTAGAVLVLAALFIYVTAHGQGQFVTGITTGLSA